jgi:carbamoylphosphate synthase large subunit
VPARRDIHSICVIGSGPIVIGQACEFDYAGCQALKVLREDGYRTIVVNSNPATIMTDPGFADRTYIEPLDLQGVSDVLRRERPDAILPTLGGQTALNIAIELSDAGVLEELGVELLGAGVDVIHRAEDRELFRDAVKSCGLHTPESCIVTSVDDLDGIAVPAVVRPAFTLGGHGGGFADTVEQLRAQVERGLRESPINQVLVEDSVKGWDEFELEVMRDRNDNVVIVCSIENLDPMGVHTGDSVTVAPQMTLSDEAYQELRDASVAIIRAVGVETGGSNIQFARSRETGEIRVIEMNPRVSRSSALASKATGYPIAKVAAKLAVGYTLDEIPNDLTKTTPASFEPTLDYVVVKFPRFAFEKFPGADPTLGTQMKSVGEAMAIGRTFKEAFLKGIRSLELGKTGRLFTPIAKDEEFDEAALRKKLVVPTDRRMWAVFEALDRGWTTETIHEEVRARYAQDWIADPNFPLVWRLQEKFSGSGANGDIDSHIIDLGRYLVGEISEVCGGLMETFIKKRPVLEEVGEGLGAKAGKKLGTVMVDRAVSWIGRFKNGAVANFEATRFAYGRKNHVTLEINGSNGSLFFDLEEMNRLKYFNLDDSADARGFRDILVTEPVHPYGAAWWPPGHIIGYEHTFTHTVYDLLEAMAGKKKTVKPDFEDGLRNQLVLAAIEKASATRRWTKVG